MQFSPDQLAASLGVSLGSIYYAIRRGRLPASTFRVGMRLQYAIAEADAVAFSAGYRPRGLKRYPIERASHS